MEERIEQQPDFEEEQRFPLWIKAIVLLPVVVLTFFAVQMWLGGPRYVTIALIFTALALFFLLLAVPNFILKLVIRLDLSHLHLRIYPLRLPVPFLPPRIRDVPLSEISHWEVRTYKSLLDREYWGPHFWAWVAHSVAMERFTSEARSEQEGGSFTPPRKDGEKKRGR